MIMTRKLNDTDRAAVDLILDRTPTASDGNGGDSNYVVMTSAVPEQRLQSVERVLSTLSTMPAAEPPADLAVRTLQLIARRTTTTIPEMPGTFADPSQPMA
jgi:hypothetical protein